MVKTIKINSKESFKINSSMGWIYTYQEQFGHDVMVVLLPALEAALGAAIDLLQNVDTKGKKEIDVAELVKSADEQTIQTLMLSLSSAQLYMLTNVVWALAKNADDDIAEPKEWFNSFEQFPLDEILPEVLKIVVNACFSKKKIQKIRDLFSSLRANPSESSESPLPESTED